MYFLHHKDLTTEAAKTGFKNYLIRKNIVYSIKRLNWRLNSWFLLLSIHSHDIWIVMQILHQYKSNEMNVHANVCTTQNHTFFTHWCDVFFASQGSRYHGPMKLALNFFDSKNKVTFVKWVSTVFADFLFHKKEKSPIDCKLG